MLTFVCRLPWELTSVYNNHFIKSCSSKKVLAKGVNACIWSDLWMQLRLFYAIAWNKNLYTKPFNRFVLKITLALETYPVTRTHENLLTYVHGMDIKNTQTKNNNCRFYKEFSHVWIELKTLGFVGSG